MSDLIERQAAIERIDEALSRVIKGPCGEKILARVPSAQPEIIRCRECRWWDPCPSSTIAPLYHLCRRVGRMNMTADDFCSRAERWEVSE